MRLPRGRHWEAVAAEHVEDHGLVVLARDYRCRLGEIDLVCRDGPMLVMIEVRARAAGAPCSAIETVDARKRARLVRATKHYLMRRSEWRHAPIRFDVVAFDAIDTPEVRLSWIKNAFDAS
jgi:putative endonuclease